MRLFLRERNVLSRARVEAQQLQHRYVGPEHILLVFLTDDHPLAETLLPLGLSRSAVKEVVLQLVPASSAVRGFFTPIPTTPAVRRMLEVWRREAPEMDHVAASVTLLLLMIEQARRGGAAVVAATLLALGVDTQALRNALIAIEDK